MRISDWSSDVCSSDLILERMHGGIRLAGQHRHFQLLQEQPLAANRRQRAIQHPIAARAHRHQLHLQAGMGGRSEEHTSELQSLMRISYAVFCLKKKKTTDQRNNIIT